MDRTYADKVNAPLSARTVDALRVRIASGQAPRRRVQRRTQGRP